MRAKPLELALVLALLASAAGRIGAQGSSSCIPADTANWPAMELARSDSAHPPPDVYLASQIDVPVRGGLGSCVTAAIPSSAAKLFSDYAIVEFIVNVDGSIDRSSFKVLRATNLTVAARYSNGPVGMGTFTPAELQGKKVRQLVQQAVFLPKKPSGITQRDSAVNVSVKGDSTLAKTYFEFQVQQPARVLKQGMLVYPPDLRANKITGSVLAQFVVLENGAADMDTFKVLQSTNRGFTEAVRAVVPQMLFSPGQVGGHPVRQLVQLPFQFRLNDVAADTSIITLPNGALIRRVWTLDSLRARGKQTFALPASNSTQVYTAAQVDKPVRNPNGAALSKTVPAEVVAMFGGERLLEFVVNTDGKVEPGTARLITASDSLVASMPIGDLHDMYFIPAELHGQRVRQIVQLAMPVSIRPAR